MKEAITLKEVCKEFKTPLKNKSFLGNLFNPEYKVVKAVKSLSFGIKEGELVGFIGPNGAGKSTTIKMLSGILFPSSGEINVLGFNPQKDRIKLAYKIGTIFGQRQQLSYHLPAKDSYELFSAIYDIEPEIYKEKLERFIKLFEIERFIETPVRKLSLGERMRCEFVGSLLHDPKVLFLDEPTIGMDIVAKKKIREYIKKLNKEQKTTIILTSHDLSDIEELCDRIIIINKGEILYDGSINEIRRKVPYKRVEILFNDENPVLRKLRYIKLLSQEAYKAVIEIDLRKISVKQVLDILLKEYDIEDILIENPPIEEIIETFYK